MGMISHLKKKLIHYGEHLGDMHVFLGEINGTLAQISMRICTCTVKSPEFDSYLLHR